MRRERRSCGALAALTGLLLLAGCGADGGPGRSVTVGAPAPEYATVSLEGDSVSLVGLRGEVVLLNVWATWCGPCREEMPDLQAIQEDYADGGLRVVGVSIDQAHARGEVRSFLEDHGITFAVLHDAEGRIARTFRTVGVPETFLIGADGTLLARWIGRIDPAAVRRRLDEASSGSPGHP